MPVLNEIKPGAVYETDGPLTVRGDIGPSAAITVINGGITAVSVGQGATVHADGTSTFRGDIGLAAKVIVHNGSVTVVNVGQGATVRAESTSTFRGDIGSCAAVTVFNGGITAVNVGRGAIVRAEGTSIFRGNIEEDADVTVRNGDLTVNGNIASGAKINLNGGLLRIRGTISPNCTITGASSLSRYTSSTEVNGNRSMIAHGGSVNFVRCNGSSFISGSKRNTATITDLTTGKSIKICQDPSSGEITVNGHKMPFRNKHQFITDEKDGKLIVNGYKVEIDAQGVRVNGQRVVDGVIQAISQPSVSVIAPNESDIESAFVSTGPALFAAPPSLQATRQQKTNAESPLLPKVGVKQDRRCCAVM